MPARTTEPEVEMVESPNSIRLAELERPGSGPNPTLIVRICRSMVGPVDFHA
jgi:hypothetical protein